MAVWENSKDDVNRLNKIIELQTNIIDVLIKNNNYLYEQLIMQKENDKQHKDYEKLLMGVDKLSNPRNEKS